MNRKELMNSIKHLNWKRTPHSNVLRCDSGKCPITAAYRIKFNKDISNFAWDRAASELGIEYEIAREIVREADCRVVPELEKTNG